MSKPQANQPPTFTSFANWCLHKDNLSKGAKHTVEVLLKIAGTSQCNFASMILSNCAKKLNLRNNYIRDISPLSSLVNLTSLDLRSNQITDISPLSSLVNLTQLDLRYNQITDISPISSLVNLTSLHLDDNQITDLSPLQSLDNLNNVSIYGVYLPKKYLTHQQWQAQWLLEEDNAEIRRLLIQTIGYEIICQELKAIELDTWREYTLLEINIHVRDEPIYLLKMTCPSTEHVHVLRVPPDINSAREAIRWVNWGIEPEEFAVQT